MFYLIFIQVIRNTNLPKVCGLRNQILLRFYLIFIQVIRNINLPKVHGPRNLTRPMFCLIFIQVINVTYNVINENVAELPFINNSTFASYLHSKVAVQLFCLVLLGSMHLCLLLRRYSMALPSWALTSPMLGFFQYPQSFSIPSP